MLPKIINDIINKPVVQKSTDTLGNIANLIATRLSSPEMNPRTIEDTKKWMANSGMYESGMMGMAAPEAMMGLKDRRLVEGVLKKLKANKALDVAEVDELRKIYDAVVPVGVKASTVQDMANELSAFSQLPNTNIKQIKL